MSGPVHQLVEKNDSFRTLRIIPYCKLPPKDNILLWQNAQLFISTSLPWLLSKKASGCTAGEGTDHGPLQWKGRRIPRCISVGVIWILAGTPGYSRSYLLPELRLLRCNWPFSFCSGDKQNPPLLAPHIPLWSGSSPEGYGAPRQLHQT